MNWLPTLHTIAAIALATSMFVAFAKGWRVEIVSLLVIGLLALGLYFVPLPGTTPNDGLATAFGGFGHPALITICALMILGRGLVVTGALDPLARALIGLWRFNRQIGLLTTLVMAFFLSMIVNDTPVLVLLLPIMVQLAAQGAMPPSKTLIPINAAILIGGMATTIGTSTNLLVVSIASDLGMPEIPVFHFTSIVLVAGLVALPYIWLVMPRLLGDNSLAKNVPAREFLSTLRYDADSAAGKPIEALLKNLPESIVVISAGPGIAGPETRIVIRGTPDALFDATQRTGGKLAPIWLVSRLSAEAQAAQEDMVLAELIIAPDSRLIGLTLQNAGLEGVAVLGVHSARRTGAFLAPGMPNLLQEGDLLLVQGTELRLQQFAHADGLLLLEGGKSIPRSNKAPLALAIMAGAVALASLGLTPIAISALGGAVLMLVTGCVKFERVGRALSAQVIVLVAASIALGKFMLVSGAANWLGGLLAVVFQLLPPAGVLAAIMLFVTLLTNFASNATAAAVGTPIAFTLATKLGLPPEPMVLAVLFGCNLCYATPVAYQTNMMIMAEGNYEFADYIRTGLPLVLIMVITLSISLTISYGL